MKNPRLDRWKDLGKTEGLLLFAQRVQECLFDYSLDSYRAPSLNTHTRCLELLRNIHDVDRGTVSAKALKPLTEELAHSIRDDSAVKALLGSHSDQLADPEWWDVANVARLRVQGELLRGFLFKRRYRTELTRQLMALVGDPKQKTSILAVTTDLVVEWMSDGFSRDHIYSSTKRFFFCLGGEDIAEPAVALGSFLDLFEITRRKYDVCIRVSTPWSALDKDTLKGFMDLLPAAPAPRSKSVREIHFLARRHEGSYAILTDIDALDTRAASNEAFRRLSVLADDAGCHTHRSPFSWDWESLVWEAGRAIVLKRSIPPVHKEDECPSGEIATRFGATVDALGPHSMGETSWRRLAAAFSLHSAALRSSDVAVQLSTLWSAFEALAPIVGDDSKIGAVADALVPALARYYTVKLLRDLRATLRLCCPASLKKTCAGVAGPDPEIVQLAAILSIDSNEKLRDILYMGLRYNPLMRHRVFALKRSLESAGGILAMLAAHKQRVRWHLSRIYRNRNLIIHAGESLPYRDSLVENLHG